MCLLPDSYPKSSHPTCRVATWVERALWLPFKELHPCRCERHSSAVSSASGVNRKEISCNDVRTLSFKAIMLTVKMEERGKEGRRRGYHCRSCGRTGGLLAVPFHSVPYFNTTHWSAVMHYSTLQLMIYPQCVAKPPVQCVLWTFLFPPDVYFWMNHECYFINLSWAGLKWTCYFFHH